MAKHIRIGQPVNAAESWAFEFLEENLPPEYCNGGLSIIKSWLDDHPEDIDGTDTLHDQIFKQISAISSSNMQRGKLAGVEF
jgi:hypothetical protein